MEVKDLKVSIAPQEVLELVWQQINNGHFRRISG